MAFASNAYSNYFRAIQSPVCSVFGPTGPPGSGSTGATGPAGPAGTNGISTGLIYYFHAQSVGGQPNDGDTGFAMNTNIQPGPAGGNPVYLPTVYNGYFSETHPTAGSTGPVLLGDFKTSAGDPGVTVIPAGSWTFLMNIYTGVDYTGSGNTGITGSAGTSINVYAEVWKTSQGVSSLIGDNKTRSIVVNSATDDQLYSMGVTIQTAQTLFTPSVDSMFVRIYAVPTTSTFVANQRIEFWTDGDSVSQVTTTLPAKSGNTGSTGAAGPTGAIGLPGTPGQNGSQGIQGPMGQSTWTPVLADSTRITQSATTSGVFTKTGGTNALWDSAVRSAQAYSAGAYVSFDTPSTLSEAVIGLSDAPSINTTPPVSLNVITYGINYNVNGTSFYFIEAGVSIGPNVCAVGDRFSIIYDGVNVIYYQNGVVKRTVARAIGLPLHLESNFYYIGSTTSNLVFGPASPSGLLFGVVATFQGGTGVIGSTAIIPNSSTYIYGQTGNTGRALYFNPAAIFQTSLNLMTSTIQPFIDANNYPAFNILAPGTYKAVFTCNNITGATPPSTGQFWNIPFGINVGSVNIAGNSNSQCLLLQASNSQPNGTGYPLPINTFYFTTTTANTAVYLANNFSYFVPASTGLGFDIILLGRYIIEFTRLS